MRVGFFNLSECRVLGFIKRFNIYFFVLFKHSPSSSSAYPIFYHLKSKSSNISYSQKLQTITQRNIISINAFNFSPKNGN